MRSRRRSRVRKRVIFALLCFVIILVCIGIWNFGKYVPVLLPTSSKHPLHLKVTPQKRINVLLLGVGGGSHEGPNLTDTIIFASIDPDTKKVVMVSLPRDLWVPDLSAKINTAYTYGEEKQKGGGLTLAKAVTGKTVGQQIDYAVKIDFSGFEKAVDIAGGLDIDVENTFDDYAYPLSGLEDASCGLTNDTIASLSAQIASGSATELESFPCRYEHLHFDKGPSHMNGESALKYVRSRHALGKEGSDFARSKRQAKIISAFKDKIFSVDTFLNPLKLVNLINTLQGSIETDISSDEYPDFIKLAQKLKGAKLSSAVIDAGDSQEERFGLLTSPPISDEYGKQWVLSPRAGNGDYSEIKEYVACQINKGNCIIGETGILTPTPQVTKSVSK